MLDLLVNLLTATEFWSAVVGAIVGGLIAFAINWQSLRFAAKAREVEHSQRQQSLGRSLLIKLVRIQSDLSICHRCFQHISDDAVVQDLAASPMWTQVPPLTWLPETISFTTDELALLIELGEPRAFDAIASMDRIHAALIGLLHQLNQHTQLLRDRLKPEDIREGVATVDMTSEEFRAHLPKIVEVNDLVRSIIKSRSKDLDDTENAMTALRRVLKEHLNIDVSVTVPGL